MLSLNKNDAINLFIIILTAYFLLNLNTNPNLSSYEKTLSMGKNSNEMQQISQYSVLIGMAFLIIIYAISRMYFKQEPNHTLIASLLTISCYAFINNFAFGISDLTYSLFGKLVTPSFGLEKIYQILPLLPLSVLSLYILYSKKKMNYLFTGIAALIASFFMPLISLPFLFVLSADGISKINYIKDRNKLSTITGAFLATVISLTILKFTTMAIALSILIGLVIAVVMLSFENKHTLLYLLTITLLMVSLENAIANVITAKTIDNETIEVSKWINGLDGNIAFASIYGENVTTIVKVETGKDVSSQDAFVFLFTNKTPNFNYLILDTLVLDAPKEYAKVVDTTVTFQTFLFAGVQKQSDTYYQIYTTYDNTIMLIPTDSNGKAIGNKVIINGVEDSYFKLLYLNASDPIYYRYINPKADSNKNIFKVLYPEQFGEIKGYKITEINQTNSSRFRLYQITQQ
jgi:hypothetical protein